MPATPVITELVELYDVPALADGEGIVKQGGVLTAVELASSADVGVVAAAVTAGDAATLTSAVGAAAGLALVLGG